MRHERRTPYPDTGGGNRVPVVVMVESKLQTFERTISRSGKGSTHLSEKNQKEGEEELKLLRIGNRWINADLITKIVDLETDNQIDVLFSGSENWSFFKGNEREALLRWLALNDSVLDTTFVTVATIPPVTKPVGVELAPELVDMSLDGFKAMVKRGGFVVLDTETTGLHDADDQPTGVVRLRVMAHPDDCGKAIALLKKKLGKDAVLTEVSDPYENRKGAGVRVYSTLVLK
jgi:hypothetical protein